MPRPEAGFSLIELTLTAAIASLLALIAAPSWVSFVQRQQLIQAQDQVYRIIQQTQQQAIAHRTPQQVSFRSTAVGGKSAVAWARHQSHTVPRKLDWRTLSVKGHLDIDTAASTFRQEAGNHLVAFDHQGNVSGQLGRLTLGTGGLQRCVVVATRLGALRKGRGDGQGRCE